eukprot:gene7673-600_t
MAISSNNPDLNRDSTHRMRGRKLAPIITYSTLILSLVSGTIFLALDQNHHPLTFIGGTLLAWSLSAMAAIYFMIYPPFRIYQGPSHKTLTTNVRGAARSVWGDHVADPHSDFGLHYEEITIPVWDVEKMLPTGATLHGWYLPAQNPQNNCDNSDLLPSESISEPVFSGPALAERTITLILVHGAGRDRRAFLRHAYHLHHRGYALLLCDLREHGLSFGQGHGINYGPRECDDISSMVFWLRLVKQHKIIVVCGTSTGASASIMAAARIRDPTSLMYIHGVIAENPFLSRRELFRCLVESYYVLPGRFDCLLYPYRTCLNAIAYFVVTLRDPAFRREPIDCITDISPRPVLLMHGLNDKIIPAWHTAALYEEARFPKEVWLVEDAEHTALFNVQPQEWMARSVIVKINALESN